MTTNYRNEIQAEIQRFDAIKRESTEATFAANLSGEGPDQSLCQTFEVTLSDDPFIEASADIHPRGTIASVTVYVEEGGKQVQRTDIEPGSGIWQAMELWLNDFRTTWEGDSY